jgi:hypothetical protein
MQLANNLHLITFHFATPSITYIGNQKHGPFGEIEYENYQKVTSWSKSSGKNKYYYEVTEGGQRVAYGENQFSGLILTNDLFRVTRCQHFKCMLEYCCEVKYDYR